MSVVPKLPTKARTVHLSYDKAFIESVNPENCRQPEGSVESLCPVIVRLSVSLTIFLLSAKVILEWEVTILSV